MAFMQPIQPWQLLLVSLAGWINRHQQDVIAYIQEENRILKSKLKGKRIRFTDDERRRLAVKGKALGRKVLGEVASIVTPNTILACHRKLSAPKWDYSNRRGPGRPRVADDIAELTVRMAQENPNWGYTTIMGALANLSHVRTACPISTGNTPNCRGQRRFEAYPAARSDIWTLRHRTLFH